jgi:hypothetical protein
LPYFTAGTPINGVLFNESNANVVISTLGYGALPGEPPDKVYYGMPWMFQPLTVIDDRNVEPDAPVVNPGEILGIEVSSEGILIPFEIDVLIHE